MASGHLVSYLRQNVRVDRAAANQATTPKPADPRLRVQRFVRALDEHEKEVRAAALSVIIRRSLDNSFRESSCCRYVFVIQARTHRASSPWHTPHQSTACQWSMSFVFSESHRSADHQSPFRDLLSAAVSQTIIRNVSMPQRSRAISSHGRCPVASRTTSRNVELSASRRSGCMQKPTRVVLLRSEQSRTTPSD